MQLGLRIILIIGAILMLGYVLNKIRKSQLQTNDAVFWFFFAGCLVVIAIFPQIVFWLSDLIGIQSPANLVFLILVAILIMRLLAISVENAKQKQRIERLTQNIALKESIRPKTEDKGETTN